jgi:uncharacterized protein YqhQ
VAAFYYGGQAVIEGVMMRGRHDVAVAVRTREGSIVLHSEQLPSGLYRNQVGQLPFVRGLVMLWEMLVLGTRMLLWSANMQVKEELDEEIPSALAGGVLLLSLFFALALFFLFPLFVIKVTASGSGLGGHSVARNIVEGVVRLLLLVGYLSLLGRTKNLRRVFEYHGAEHKTINAYEAGAELTPASVQRFSTRHTRCGTAFLLWVMVISIVVFSLLGNGPIWWRFTSRIVLIPLIAALSYEFLRFSARFYYIPLVRWIVTPGLWLQGLTTREPDDAQVEVAITALQRVLAADGQTVATPAMTKPVPEATI